MPFALTEFPRLCLWSSPPGKACRFGPVELARLGSDWVDAGKVVRHVDERLLEGGKSCCGDPVGGLDDDSTARC